MRHLFFTNTPAHVHLYRNAVTELAAAGDEVLVLARDYGCTVDLLDWYDLPYREYGACGTTKRSLLWNLPGHYRGLLSATLSFDPDRIFGVGAYAAHAGLVSRTPAVLILDSEPTSLDHAISRPFANAILTPHAFGKSLGDRHYQFRGFGEMAYLHPDRFGLDPGIRDELGLAAGEKYVLVRFNAFGSHHDVGESGFSPTQRRDLVEGLAERATVLVSDEGGELDLSSLPARPFDVHPALLHDALAGASLVVTDAQTVCTEAALLGTPVIRSNTFVGDDDMGNFRELESQGLVYNTRSFEEVLATGRAVLNDDDIGRAWRARRDEYVAGLVDLTGVVVALAHTGDPDRVDGLERWREHEPDRSEDADPVTVAGESP